MFICKKNNPSGVISIQINVELFGHYRVVKTMGSSSEKETIVFYRIRQKMDRKPTWFERYI